MIPNFPPNPREELEARVTALLLGELSEAEAAEVRQLIARDAELSKLHGRLSQTLGLLRETIATPVGETPAQPAPLKLSPDKREKLLASFKTITPKEFEKPTRRWSSLFMPLAAAAAFLLLLVVTAPNFIRVRTASQHNSIDENLRLIDSAKQHWDIEQSALADAHKPIVLPSTARNEQLADANISHGFGGGGGGIAGVGGIIRLQNLDRDNGKTPAPEVLPGSSLPATDERGVDGTVSGTVTIAGTRRAKEEEDLLNTSPASREYASRTFNGGVTVENPTVGAEIPATPPAAVESLSEAKTKQAELAGNSGNLLSFTASSSTFQNNLASNTRKDIPEAGAKFAFNNNNYDYAAANTANLPAPAAAPAAAAPAPAPGTPQQTKMIDGYLNASTSQVSQGIVANDKEVEQTDAPLRRPHLPALVPQPEVLTRNDAFTTFSLNISDVAFKLAQASLQNGVMPDPASMRTEEFINAFNYRDPEPAPGAPIGFACEYANDPFAQNRDFLRFSIKTAAVGRQTGRPLNLVLIVDKSGSMERADRVEIISRVLNVLAQQLNPQDTLSVIVFARTARLFVDGVPGSQAGRVAKNLQDLTPEGGTNLEEAMKLAYATALRHYLANGENRVVLLTDGAANLGNVNPAALTTYVEANGKQGIALDCFGVGWEGYNDDLLETISRAGHGRYGFINTPEEAATEFAGKLAGALRVAADDVKVQVEFNPSRVVSYRQIGYAKDQLTTEQFRDNNVRAAQVGAAESGNALYAVEINPAGEGPLGTVHVRFRVPGTSDYQEHEWTVDYTGAAVPLEKASPAMRLAATGASFGEWLADSPYAGEVTPDRLLSYINGVPRVYGADDRPAKLEWMIRQAKSISGK